MKFTRLAIGLALAGLSIGANATNGYFSHGYGMKAKGMAGAATTSTEDAFFGANNPAAAAFVGNRMDLGADLFSPIRQATNVGGALSGYAESESNFFLVPEFGYNRMINPDLALGVTVYGNGGMNTNYDPIVSPAPNMLGGVGNLGVDLMQLIVAPTAAYKLAPNHSVGISPLLGYQRFRAEGLQGFAGFQAPGTPSMANNLGYDDAFGYGVRVGYLGKITPTVTIGAAYASKMNFSEFDTYAGLFAEQGDFDIPENYNVGISWQATPAVRLALDYQRINYSDINSIGNPVFPNFAFNLLGNDAGPGFGWDDVNVFKLGMEYKYNNSWTIRAGYSHANNPIEGDLACAGMPFNTTCGEVMFNILAPAVVENHITLGFTYKRANGDEITAAYMHGFDNDVSGARPGFGGGIDTIRMYQNSVGLQYSWKM